MLARTRLKLKNAESSISFMQEQHARTLEGLHKEIEKLQKKNARLSFQLTMTGMTTTAGQPQLEEELISEISRLQSSLSKEQETRTLLQHQVDDLLTRHSEEVSARDDIISQLNAELDAKASIIALLTQQLCQVRAKLKQELEARSKKPTVCACPHCFVHRKAMSSTDGRLSPLQEADHSTDTGTELSAEFNTAGKLLIPSPPSAIPSISPHPPPMAGRSRLIKRRASTPIRRQSPSPRNSLTNLSLDSSKQVAQKSLRPARVARDTSTLSTELQELLNLKDGYTKPVRRDTHPVLPPIPAPYDADNLIQENVVTENYRHVHRSCPGSQQLPVSGVSDATSSINAQRRLILKGLSSAPSALRVLHYGARKRSGAGGGGGGGGEEGEGGKEGQELTTAQEGTLLLVKENDPGRGPPQCAGAEGTLD